MVLATFRGGPCFEVLPEPGGWIGGEATVHEVTRLAFGSVGGGLDETCPDRDPSVCVEMEAANVAVSVERVGRSVADSGPAGPVGVDPPTSENFRDVSIDLGGGDDQVEVSRRRAHHRVPGVGSAHFGDSLVIGR